MPSIEANQSFWGQHYKWPSEGGEWSDRWGGVQSHWYTTLYPRVRNLLNGGNVLEIAPGYGRWSGFLIDMASAYIGVDLAEECVKHCQSRFKDIPKARFVTNDGLSLSSVSNGWVDFVFSFDSLVHAEIDVLRAYLIEFARILSTDGVALIHHSNLGAFSQFNQQLSAAVDRFTAKIPALNRKLERHGAIRWTHWRAPSVSAQNVATIAQEVGLRCVGQEIVSWGDNNSRPIDCLSIFARPGSRWDRSPVSVQNKFFMQEADSARQMAQVFYSFSPPTTP